MERTKYVSWAGADVFPAVQIVGADISDRTGSDAGAFAQDSDFERAFLQHDHLFVDVLMGRMRHLAGRKSRDVQFDRQSGVGLAV